jgi:RsiW-degrading membrane proteinase PrsW (M82 family)
MIIHIKALSIAATSVIWFVTAITILMELFEEPIKPMLTSVTGHHWVTKGLFAVILFAAVYGLCVLFVADSRENARPVYVAIGSAVLGGLTIFLFFVWHFFA